MRPGLEILHEDDAIVVINKPAGVLSIADRFETDKGNLHQMLQERYGDAHVIQRLDKDTSGVICFARDLESKVFLTEQLERKLIQKHYFALVNGVPAEESGTIDASIAPHPGQSGQMVAGRKGKAALTRYQVMETFKQYSWCEVEIMTGWTHQIRVHFQYIGHPLAVDPLYGRKSALFLSDFKKKHFQLGKEQEEKPLISRLSLHAHRLILSHPRTGKSLQFEAPLPKDLKAALQQLRKWNVG